MTEIKISDFIQDNFNTKFSRAKNFQLNDEKGSIVIGPCKNAADFYKEFFPYIVKEKLLTKTELLQIIKGGNTPQAQHTYKIDFADGTPYYWNVVGNEEGFAQVQKIFIKVCSLKPIIKDYKLVINANSVISKNSALQATGLTSIVSSFDLNFRNLILYGVPGCGKSHYINEHFGAYLTDVKYYERIVFHPEYTYSDFIGQVMPVSTKTSSGAHSIDYPFVPGPFTRLLKRAIESEKIFTKASGLSSDYPETNNNELEHPYFLFIEEINRGNAPAIFGDIFQLLDRDKSGKSEYKIANEYIGKELYGEKYRNDDEKFYIYLPSNFYIIATMNTADQGVFTLDTAFKRRWQMKNIRNKFEGGLSDHIIAGTAITWSTFAKTINEEIAKQSNTGIGTDDRSIGAWFVTEYELDNPQLFAEKVLMYLWGDVFKYNHDNIFKPEYNTLEKLLDGYTKEKLGVFNLTFETVEESSSTSGAYGSVMGPEKYKPYFASTYSQIKDTFDDIVKRLQTKEPDIYIMSHSAALKLVHNDASKNNRPASVTVSPTDGTFSEIVFRTDSLIATICELQNPATVAKASKYQYDNNPDYAGGHSSFSHIMRVPLGSDYSDLIEILEQAYKEMSGK